MKKLTENMKRALAYVAETQARHVGGGDWANPGHRPLTVSTARALNARGLLDWASGPTEWTTGGSHGRVWTEVGEARLSLTDAGILALVDAGRNMAAWFAVRIIHLERAESNWRGRGEDSGADLLVERIRAEKARADALGLLEAVERSVKFYTDTRSPARWVA